MTTIRKATLPLIAGGLLMLPAGLIGANNMKCEYGAPTPESYTWDFSGEANEKFTEIERLTDQIQREADDLIRYNSRSKTLDVETQDLKLTRIRADVNEISSRLCRLNLIDRVLEPWQQNVVDHLDSEFQTLARNTIHAVDTVQDNRYQERLVLNQSYQTSLDEIYDQAIMISEMVEDGLRTREVVDLESRFQTSGD